ncbi:MAG: YcgN family cysteine cluster protein [Congregibacter sp.]
MDGDRFWERLSLDEMSTEQWEALCDGCARCCLHKLQDADTGEIHYTSISCQLLDARRCACSDYANRQRRIPDCVVLRPEQRGDFNWLPDTCAYRRLDRGDALPDWHPLITGDRDSVHRAGISVRGKVVSENDVHEDDYDTFIIKWVASTHR